MKLMAIQDYREMRFVGERKPSLRTIQRWINNGTLPGKKIGGLYFVDVADEEKSITGDSAADAILARM